MHSADYARIRWRGDMLSLVQLLAYKGIFASMLTMFIFVCTRTLRPLIAG